MKQLQPFLLKMLTSKMLTLKTLTSKTLTSKSLACLTLCMVFSMTAFAQIERGDKYDLVTFGIGASTLGLPIFACIEQTYDDSKSYGAMVSYRRYNEAWQVGQWQHDYLGLGARGDQHFDIDLEGLDLFAGLNVGWYLHSWKQTGGTTTGSPDYGGNNTGGLGFGGQIGGRYMWKDFNFFLQLGGGSVASGALFGLSYYL